jgi:UDP-N-acetylmuramate--alanine ligase
MFITKRKIHMIGIGGSGMSGLAELLKRRGCAVSGSDRERSAVTRRLESLGIRIQYGHAPRLIKKAELAVFSSAIGGGNPERRWASKHGIEQMRRAEALGQLMRSAFTVAVAGTHGKTTTASLIGHLLACAGLDPSVIVGGVPRGWKSGAVAGSGRVLVAEADEFDRSFLCMSPSAAVITNIEPEHLDCYRGIGELRDAFVQFANATPFFGGVFVCADNPNVRRVLPRITAPLIRYGLDGPWEYRAKKITFENGRARFTVCHRGTGLGRVETALPGMHNVRNCLAAVAVCRELGVAFPLIAKSIGRFRGVKRRFELRGTARGVAVIDDYAHHPDEIGATFDAARRAGYSRCVAVFQPHLYSRTMHLGGAFARSLMPFHRVVVTGIYRSRERRIAGVSAASIVAEMKRMGHRKVGYVPRARSVPGALRGRLDGADAVVVMGAGDIGTIAGPLLEELRNG